MARILVFENNPAMADSITMTLQGAGYDDILTCTSPATVPESHEVWRDIKLAVIDLIMGYGSLPEDWRGSTMNGDLTGWVVFDHLCTNKNLPVIILTGLSDSKKINIVANAANWRRKPTILKKPMNPDILLMRVEEVLSQ